MNFLGDAPPPSKGPPPKQFPLGKGGKQFPLGTFVFRMDLQLLRDPLRVALGGCQDPHFHRLYKVFDSAKSRSVLLKT